MSTIRVGTHLFGSSEGYRTLAKSRDVSDAEESELTGFGFGQTTDRDFLESLESNPSAFGRPLVGGRIAVTRLFEGRKDEAGRSTLELRTILVSGPDAVTLFRAGVGCMLQLPGLWDEQAFRRGAAREIALAELPDAPNSPAPTNHEAALLEAWADAVVDPRARVEDGLAMLEPEARALVVIEPEAIGSDALSSLVARLGTADLERCRWGLRLLSTAGPIDLCTMAPSGRVGARRRTIRLRLGELGPVAESVDTPNLARVAAQRMMAGHAEQPTGRTRRRSWVLVPIAAVALLLLSIAFWPAADDTGESGTDRVPVVAADSPTDPIDISDRSADEAFVLVEEVEVASGSVTATAFAESVVIAVEVPHPDPPSVSGEALATADPRDRPSSTDPGTESPPSSAPSAQGEGEDRATAAEGDPAVATAPADGETRVDEDSSATVAGAVVADPCETCRVLAERLVATISRIEAAERLDDRSRLDQAVMDYIAVVSAIGLDQVDAERRREVLQQMRTRSPVDGSLLAEWDRWRELLCRLELWQFALSSIESTAAKISPRSESRQALMRMRRDSLWILASDRPTQENLREAIDRLRGRLREDAVVAQDSGTSGIDRGDLEEIEAWLLLQPALLGVVWEEDRYNAPGGTTLSDRTEVSQSSDSTP